MRNRTELEVLDYRIMEYNGVFYVQKRFLFFFWRTIYPYVDYGPNRVFVTLASAEEFVLRISKKRPIYHYVAHKITIPERPEPPPAPPTSLKGPE